MRRGEVRRQMEEEVHDGKESEEGRVGWGEEYVRGIRGGVGA